MSDTYEVAYPDGTLSTTVAGVTSYTREQADTIAQHTGGRVTRHVNYPHTPGYLPDCPACEYACHCGPGVAAGSEEPCVYHAEDNPRR